MSKDNKKIERENNIIHVADKETLDEIKIDVGESNDTNGGFGFGSINAKLNYIINNKMGSIELQTITNIPSQSNTLIYTGDMQSPTWNNYDENKLDIGGTLQAHNAGEYEAAFVPKTGYKWSDASVMKSVSWHIGGVELDLPIITGTLTYNGSEQSPTWNGYDSQRMLIGGDTSAINAGNYTTTFLPLTGCVWSDGTSSKKEVNWSIGKAQGTISVDKTDILLSSSNPSIIINVTKVGDGQLTAVSSDTSICTASVSGNQVTISMVNGSGDSKNTNVIVGMNESVNYLSSQSININVSVKYANVYGVQWKFDDNNKSNTKWERIEDSADFGDPIPYVLNATEYSSPFDNLEPYSGIVRETVSGQEMVKIPKFWYKIEPYTSNYNGLKILISNMEKEGFAVSPAHMDRGDGKGERDYVYVSRYKVTNNNFKSSKNYYPKVNILRADMRDGIQSSGENFYMLDYTTLFTIWLLYLVEFADWNSQNCIGYGGYGGSSEKPSTESNLSKTGYTDSMPYHTGTMLSSRTTYGMSTQYRYMEGLWDCPSIMIEGFIGYYNSWYIFNNPQYFAGLQDKNDYNYMSKGTSFNVNRKSYPSSNSYDVSGVPIKFEVASGSDSKYNGNLFFPYAYYKNATNNEAYRMNFKIGSTDYWNWPANSGTYYREVYSNGCYGNFLSMGLFFLQHQSINELQYEVQVYYGARSIYLP